MTSPLLSSPYSRQSSEERDSRKRRALNDLLGNKNGNTNSSFSTVVSLDIGNDGDLENEFYGEDNEAGADIQNYKEQRSRISSIGLSSCTKVQINTLRLLKRRDMAEKSRRSKDAVVSGMRAIQQSETPDRNTGTAKGQLRLSATLAFKDDDALYGNLVRQEPNITPSALRKQWRKTFRAASNGISQQPHTPIGSISQDPSLYHESASSNVYERIRVAGAESQFFRQYITRNHNMTCITATDPPPLEFPIDQWRKYVNEKLANKDGQQPVGKPSAEQHLLDLWEREYDLRRIDQKDERTMRNSHKAIHATPSKTQRLEKREQRLRNETAQLFNTLEKQKRVGQLLQELAHLTATYENEHHSLIEEMEFWVDMIADQREQQSEMLAEQGRLRASLSYIT